MKKNVFFVAALFTATFGMAQDLTSKKGETILPEAGDYAIGFNASPFLNYFGNMFNTGANVPFTAGYSGAQAITGKMFTDANNAYRFGVRLGLGSTSTTTLNDKFTAGAAVEGETIEDIAKVSDFNLLLSAGKEFRRGNTRLQGFYGAEAIITMGTNSTENTFGNSAADQHGTDEVSRISSSKQGTTFGIGARGFVGVEYFVAAKISIAAEYGWGLLYNNTGAGETVTETYDGAASKDVTTESGSNSTFNLDTDVKSGAISVMFHF
ncbi:MAG: hypothetical protein ACJAUV_000335 [Flavobacteriales bacterium]|jgi:hypothetical protein